MNSTNYTSETATLPDSEHRGIIAARTTAAHSWLAGPRLASTRNSDPCPLLRWLCCCLLICCFTRPHFCGHASAFRILQADLCSGNLYYLFDTANTAVKRMQYLFIDTSTIYLTLTLNVECIIYGLTLQLSNIEYLTLCISNVDTYNQFSFPQYYEFNLT